MLVINKQPVPSTTQEDTNYGNGSSWAGNLYASLEDGANHRILFLFHEEQEVFQSEVQEDGTEESKLKVQVVAFPLRLELPITRAKAINAAEMQAYNLKDALEVASFNASLARKSRENSQDEEVVEHDQFINQVKDYLTKIGITKE
jgi:hypothetical protein